MEIKGFILALWKLFNYDVRITFLLAITPYTFPLRSQPKKAVFLDLEIISFSENTHLVLGLKSDKSAAKPSSILL